MTLLTIDSFDHSSAEGAFMTKNGWTSGAWNTMSNDSGGPCADFALELGTGGGGRRVEYTVPAATAVATLVIGFRWKPAASDQITHRIYGDAGTTEHLRFIRDNANDRIQCYRGAGATLLGSTTSGSFPDGVRTYLEAKVTIDDSAGTIDIWADGNNVLSLSGIDTRNGGTAKADYFIIGAQNGLDVGYVDDLYVDTTTRYGPVGVKAVRPTAEGFYSEWTSSDGGSNADTIDEYSNSNMPDVSLWNESTTDNARDSFAMASETAFGRVDAVQWVAYANGDGGCTLTPFVRIGSTNYEGTAATMTVTDRYHTSTWLTNPATGVAWTWSEIVQAQWGYRLGGTTSCHVNQMLIEIMGRRRCGTMQIGRMAAA